MKENKMKKLFALGGMLALLAALLVACGDSDDMSMDDMAGHDMDGITMTSEGVTDAGFVNDMTPHHESAIEMAVVAQRRAEHPEIARLADQIVDAQTSEIEELGQISDRLEVSDDATLGLSMEAMGMEMDAGSLETAEPFDQAFIDMMIPHHQGAIEMAQVELQDGNDAQTRKLAQRIIDAQTREIEEMNSWRTEWYGEPSPAGGVPTS